MLPSFCSNQAVRMHLSLSQHLRDHLPTRSSRAGPPCRRASRAGAHPSRCTSAVQQPLYESSSDRAGGGARGACGGGGARGGGIACGAYGVAVGSLSIFVSAICRPSIIARSTPPTAAERPAARQPPRAASTPPVNAPDMMEFHGSSFFRMATSEQSKVEKSPPHTAKVPAQQESA